MLTPSDLERLHQIASQPSTENLWKKLLQDYLELCETQAEYVSLDQFDAALKQEIARGDEFEKELDTKHAKLVEVANKLRIERVCAKATRDLLDGIKNELRAIVNGRLTFGQMVLRIRRVLMEPTDDPLVVIDESTEIETLRKQANDVHADNLALAGKLVVAEGRLKSATSILGRAISQKKSQWADDARRWLGNFPPCGSRING